MRVAFGTDESAPMTDAVQGWLTDHGHEVVAVAVDDPWPDVGHRVGRAVADDHADFGIVCCWTGTGVSIAANKVPGVRAALCGDVGTADGARRWNDANVLALSIRATGAPLATEIVEAFLAGSIDDDERPNIDRVEPHG